MERTIYRGPGFCAVTENGVLVEYLQRDASQGGDILGGTVERMMPGIGGAFVSIGRKKAGFLPLRENSQSFAAEPLRSGTRIPVQVKKEETGGKGAFLTRDLTLAGTYVLLMPLNRYIGVSSRIQAEEDRERLRAIGRELVEQLSDGPLAGEPFGIVLRAAALEADRTQLGAETAELLREWTCIQEKIREGFSDGEVLYHQDPVQRMIAEYEAKGAVRILEAETLPADLIRQLSEAGERKIRIRNGGNIVIDRCEAMTVIDVNSGSAGAGRAGKGAGGSGFAYLETNLAACETIAAQIRLRNLGGMILIDFIDMETENDRNRVADRMREALSSDRRKTVVHGWTRLGILEMTRKRT
jgi:ribonuclease G